MGWEWLKTEAGEEEPVFRIWEWPRLTRTHKCSRLGYKCREEALIA